MATRRPSASPSSTATSSWTEDAPTAIFQLIEKHKLSLNDHVFGPGAVLGAALLGLFAAAIVPVAVGVVLFSRLFSATSRHLAGSPAAGSAVATDSPFRGSRLRGAWDTTVNTVGDRRAVCPVHQGEVC